MAKVSVIIPCYNQGEFVAETINSVLAQTYPDIEIVCINDGSSDNTRDVVNSFLDEHKNIVFIDNKENHGIIYSRNTAIEKSSGEYILPLDGDDTIEPTYIEKAVDILDKHPEIGIVYCKARLFGDINEEWGLPEFDSSDILYVNSIFCSALFRKIDFIKAGKYKDYMSHGCEDHDLWLSFIEQGLGVYRINEVLFNYRKHGTSTRTGDSIKEQDLVWKNIIKNHINLYIEDKQFLQRLVYTDHKGLRRKEKKYKKYKKLFNIILVLFIMESIALLILFLGNCIKI